MKNIAVFFGGRSVEHEISVITGMLVANTVNKEKYNVFPIYVDKNGTWHSDKQLFDADKFSQKEAEKLPIVTMTCGKNVLFRLKGKKLKELGRVAVAINCMHGENGEDGSLFGLLKMCGVPMCSPGLIASSTCMDKRFSKVVLKGLGINVVPFVAVKSVGELEDKKNKISYPAIVKPNLLGSSIGIGVAKDIITLKNAVSYALRFGERAIIEPCLNDFIEINCSAYMDERGDIKVSECERPIGQKEVLTFSDKYEGGGREFPANIDEKVSSKIKCLTEKIYRELDARGIIRIDFFLSDGKIFVNEINTVPGSLAYYLHTKTLKEFSVVLDGIIKFSEMEFAKSNSFERVFKSDILNGFGSKGAKHL